MKNEMTRNEISRRFPNVSAACLARNLPSAALQPEQPAAIAAPALGVSTDVAKLNRLERAYYDKLHADGHGWVGVQCITLKLADDCRYTPDLWTFCNGFCAWECKGFRREDSWIKLKVAARMYPMISFVLVEKTKSGWHLTAIKP